MKTSVPRGFLREAEIRFLIECHSPSRLSTVAHPSHSHLPPKPLGWW
jgi:hypothetical protein